MGRRCPDPVGVNATRKEGPPQRRFPELRRGPPAKGEKVGHPAGTPVTCVATSGRQGEPRRPAALAGLLKELADVTVPAEGAGLDREWRSCRHYCRSCP